MKMKHLFAVPLMVCIFGLALLLSSCTKEQAEPTQSLADKNISFRGGFGQDDCFEFVYPLTLIFPDGSEYLVQNIGHGIRVIRNYIRKHPGQPFEPTIKFPYEIIYKKDGKHEVIKDESDEQAALQNCQTTTNDPLIGECYDLIFPITVHLPGDGTKQANSQGEYDEIIKEWEKSNPNATDSPTFELPYSVRLKNGRIILIESYQDQQELNKRCQKRDRRPKTTGNRINPIDN